jgi:anti-sigma factor RsiW
MSCDRMEGKILAYIDGRLKQSERLDVEKHLNACAACKLRVQEFRAVNSLLDELPQIEPSEAFDLRVYARVAAEPVKQSWWAWLHVSPRAAFAGVALALAALWIGSLPTEQPAIDAKDLPVVESSDYDVISSFAPLADLSQVPAQDEDSDASANTTQPM